MYPRDKARTSPLWQVFKYISPGVALCCICKNTFSFKSSSTNLKQHLVSRHYGVYDRIMGNAANDQNKETSDAFVVHLIELVEEHPCLWDSRSNSYGNVELQHAAWNTIAAELCPIENQSEVVQRISDQFNALRNGFFTYVSRCAFFRELSFMGPLLDEHNKGILPIASREVYNNAADANEVIQTLNDECNIDRNEGLNRLTSIERFQMHSREATTESPKCNLRLNNADEDNLFLLSISDEMKRIPDEFQMQFKSELLVEFSKLVQMYENGIK